MRSVAAVLLSAWVVGAVPPPQGATCEDLRLANGDAWNAGQPGLDCALWGSDNRYCGRFGHDNRYRNEYLPNEACCACGGGTVTPGAVVAPAPGSCPPRVRKAYSTLSCEERMLYARAVRELKRRHPSDHDDLVAAHLHGAPYAHGTTVFLPWHRYYLIGYENALRSLGGEFACVTIPYWDWEMDAGSEADSSVMQSATFGASDDVDSSGCVNSGIAATQGGWVDGEGQCLRRVFQSGVQFTGEARIAEIITENPRYTDFRRILEAAPHASPHIMVAGQMSTMRSPEDPFFYMHHANVDRLWALWQDYHGYATIPKADLDETHYTAEVDGAQVLASSVAFDSEMLFRLPDGRIPRFTQGPVTPREMMDITDMPLGASYTYGSDGLAALIDDADSTPHSWIWAVSEELPAVTCPQHDAKGATGSRRAGTLAAADRAGAVRGKRHRHAGALGGERAGAVRGERHSRATEIAKRVRAAVKELRQKMRKAASATEVLASAAKLECRLINADGKPRAQVADSWLAMMNQPPSFRRYYDTCPVQPLSPFL